MDTNIIKHKNVLSYMFFFFFINFILIQMLNVKHITYNNYKQAKEYSCKKIIIINR